MRELLKKMIKKLSPLPLSKNHRYDRLTEKIIKRYCTRTSNCIDVGCHNGDVLEIFLRFASQGEHFAFEPIPCLFENLALKYSKNARCHIYNYAVCNSEGQATFNHVITNSSYSGLKKRKYDRNNEKDVTILVSTTKLDNVIPRELKIDFIKIDVEGGEFDVLLGAVQIISVYHPLIVFEFGLGGSDVYGCTPEMIFRFFTDHTNKITNLDSFLSDKTALTPEELQKIFYNKTDYYFIAAAEN